EPPRGQSTKDRLPVNVAFTGRYETVLQQTAVLGSDRCQVRSGNGRSQLKRLARFQQVARLEVSTEKLRIVSGHKVCQSRRVEAHVRTRVSMVANTDAVSPPQLLPFGESFAHRVDLFLVRLL